ncbi:MAG: metal ABC transporter substrate-binding protein [Thermoanaerobaculia bacterium]
MRQAESGTPRARSGTNRAACSALALAAALISLAIAGRESQRPVAAATIAPLSDFVSRVAGSGWEIRTVVPPGTSPHVFEPTPRHVRQLAEARLLVTVGFEYDTWARRLVEASASRATVHDAGLSLGELGSVGLSEQERDPHWWLAPELAARALGPIAERFVALDPGGAAGYRARAKESARDFRSLEHEIAATLLPVRGRAFLSAHPAWSYFASSFGLREIGSLEPVPGREASPLELKSLIDTARREKLIALFTEPQFPISAARVVADDAGLRLLTLDPIGGVAGRTTYTELMSYNASVFLSGLRR